MWFKKKEEISESQAVYVCIKCNRCFEEEAGVISPLKNIGKGFLVQVSFICDACAEKGLLEEKEENDHIKLIADKLNIEVNDIKFMMGRGEE